MFLIYSYKKSNYTAWFKNSEILNQAGTGT